ncbi:YciE/YciF ferroxidase family protein [Terriglobus sp. ADX1]|uniref:YciE/YciF ferroxidase family protein n=1 Tax=Terriglobus sp. ADX1 TaxID=2794063 RepID=UPI002FE5AC78
MKIFSANIESLTELYNTELRKALDLEETIVKALPAMIDKATDEQLKQGLKSHLQESEQHVDRVKQLLSGFEDSDSEKCKVIHALVSEAEDGMKDASDADVRDIAIIGAAQQVEHHEIAVYGTLKSWARILGRTEDVSLIELIERDEKHADKLLSDISDRVNSVAPVSKAA